MGSHFSRILYKARADLICSWLNLNFWHGLKPIEPERLKPLGVLSTVCAFLLVFVPVDVVRASEEIVLSLKVGQQDFLLNRDWIDLPLYRGTFRGGFSPQSEIFLDIPIAPGRRASVGVQADRMNLDALAAFHEVRTKAAGPMNCDGDRHEREHLLVRCGWRDGKVYWLESCEGVICSTRINFSKSSITVRIAKGDIERVEQVISKICAAMIPPVAAKGRLDSYNC